MALVVETGTGLVNATAYVSVSFVDGYHRARINSDWGNGSNQAKEASILNATMFVDRAFQYDGAKKVSTQALKWPRTGVFTYDEDQFEISPDSIPIQLRQAVAEFALVDLTGELLPSAGVAGLIREQVGEIEIEREISGAADQSGASDNPEAFLRGLLLILPLTVTSHAAGAAPIMRG